MTDPSVVVYAIVFEAGDQAIPPEATFVARTRAGLSPFVGAASRLLFSTHSSQRPSGDHRSSCTSLGTNAAPGIPLCANATGSPPATGSAIRPPDELS